MSSVLILTVSHGASHRRAAEALQAALLELCLDARAEVVDALAHCTRWFRAYYDSYEIPLRYWPALWRRIEAIQHRSRSTGPYWLYRQGAQPLFDFIETWNPDAVVATEVGLCELAAMLKRERGTRFQLAALELMDFNQAWIQQEVDLFLASHPDLAAELVTAGAPPGKVVCCGIPIHLSFGSVPEREEARYRLNLHPELPLLLVLFGGTGFGKASEITAALQRVHQPFQSVFIAGRNARLKAQLRRFASALPNCRVLGWVDNVRDWMAAADLLISKPGGSTLFEAAACGLPVLAFAPLPGNEERTCRWIEKWRAGLWARRPAELAAMVDQLLAKPAELRDLRQRTQVLARPHAAYEAARWVLALATEGNQRKGNANEAGYNDVRPSEPRLEGFKK